MRFVIRHAIPGSNSKGFVNRVLFKTTRALNTYLEIQIESLDKVETNGHTADFIQKVAAFPT